ncbi:wall-associated receptor kinase-like 1 [Pistacia vera]|uniref:wall-associated receptor kinase-like 1 n=1 Tax=Pistacia vera TaxID=55513 RepID=UPI0012636AC7|nr:wall-associated receptor kinase-like 1 [Pistacia vera]
MEPYSSLSFLISIFLLLSPFFNPSNCQQTYLNNTQLDCQKNPSISKGYLCNGLETSCQSFITFRSQPPYDSPIRIAYLLGSEASGITSINNISSNNDTIPPGKLVIIPVSCSCSSGSIYQHNTPYTIKSNETYLSIANNTYQGLTTCQALMGQNYYDELSLEPGLQLTVPLRCACPSANQTANGVSSLLAYMVTWGDTIGSMADLFGVDEKSILEANKLSQDSLIYPFTPLLIPLKSESCSKNPEKFFCYCPADGSLDGISYCKTEGKKFPVKLVTLLGIGIGLGLLCMFLLGYNLYKFLKKRRNRLEREKLFKQNGGFLLQQRLSSSGSSENAKIFTAEELQIATDNYNRSRFLGQGGFGTVYKGMLLDGTIVAVKRAKAIDKSQIQHFINEVVILSQINHRNIVKLLGCCLETEVPVLVYEFIPNGTLSHHIHNHQQAQEASLSWEHRVQIACEVAGALAYMHSTASIPIFHRDIKSSNILLDEKYSAKVSDFGTSKSNPNDKTHITTAVQGTFGYLDPEYFQSSQFTEKSDVYSFGVVLVELLTGKKPISLDEEERNVVSHFISLAKENKVMEILDARVAKEASEEDIQTIVVLALSCLRLNGKKRPTMKHVALELEGLRRSQRCVEIKQELQVLNDEISMNGEESITNSLVFPLKMESPSL